MKNLPHLALAVAGGVLLGTTFAQAQRAPSAVYETGKKMSLKGVVFGCGERESTLPLERSMASSGSYWTILAD